ncbi:MAG TPA: hypothetical protein VI752_01195 [Candidatus Paceibacterota bacterium]
MLPVGTQNIMRNIGLVHVTGLILKEKDLPRLPVIAHPDEYGTWDRAPGGMLDTEPSRHPRFLVITTDGEVWIMSGDLGNIPNNLLDELCPNGRTPKAWWPTFWALNPDDLLRRMRQPYWEYAAYTPSPKEVATYCKRQLTVRGY